MNVYLQELLCIANKLVHISGAIHQLRVLVPGGVSPTAHGDQHLGGRISLPHSLDNPGIVIIVNVGQGTAGRGAHGVLVELGEGVDNVGALVGGDVLGDKLAVTVPHAGPVGKVANHLNSKRFELINKKETFMYIQMDFCFYV